MRQWKKTLLMLMCAGIIFGMTACGTDEKYEEDQSGVLEEAGEELDQGIHDVEEDVKRGVDDIKDGVDDITEETDRANHAAPDDEIRNQDQKTRH